MFYDRFEVNFHFQIMKTLKIHEIVIIIIIIIIILIIIKKFIVIMYFHCFAIELFVPSYKFSELILPNFYAHSVNEVIRKKILFEILSCLTHSILVEKF